MRMPKTTNPAVICAGVISCVVPLVNSMEPASGHTQKASTQSRAISIASAMPPVAPQRAEPKVLSPQQWQQAIAQLRAMKLKVPLDGYDPKRMKGSFYEGRGNQRHEAVDMLAPRNTPIHAVSDGKIVKLFHSRLGGTTIYQFDPQSKFVFYYAHLERYADELHDGQLVRRGDIIGFVGTSGNAPPNTPHLHLSISILGPLKQWWKAIPIDPYEVFAGT